MSQSDRTDEFSFELRPSEIHGVGVFIRHFVVEGIRLDLWGDENVYRKVDEVVEHHQKELIERHGVNGYYPMFMNRMGIGWYLNHSKHPNVESRADDNVYSLRPLRNGEELTIDYGTLEAVERIPYHGRI